MRAPRPADGEGTRESDFLFGDATARASSEGQTSNTRAAGLDWDRLLSLAVRHQTALLLYHNLQATSFAGVPPATAGELRRLFLAQSRQNLALTARLLDLLDQFATVGIRALPYKGPVLAQRLYGSVTLRPFGDLDLLLPRDQVWRARDVLTAAGYSPRVALSPRQEAACLRTGDEIELSLPDGTRVELHWQLCPRLNPAPLDFERLWYRRTAVRLGDREVSTLSPEDHLLALSIHGAKHLWQPLRLVADTAELIRTTADLDWCEVVAESERTRTARIVRVALLLARELLDAPVAPAALEWAEADQTARELARYAAGPLASGGIPWTPLRRLAFSVRIKEALRDRVHFCRHWLWTPADEDWEAVRLPGTLHPLYSVLRPLRLLAKHRRRRAW